MAWNKVLIKKKKKRKTWQLKWRAMSSLSVRSSWARNCSSSLVLNAAGLFALHLNNLFPDTKLQRCETKRWSADCWRPRASYSSLICLIFRSLNVFDGFAWVQMRNGVKFWSALFQPPCWNSTRVYCRWKLESMLQYGIAVIPKGKASRTFYIVSQEASFSVAVKATANPPSHLWELKPVELYCLQWGIVADRVNSGTWLV